jgi:hypothetical protein
MAAGGVINNVWEKFGCNDYDVAIFAFSSSQTASQLISGYISSSEEPEFPIVDKDNGGPDVKAVFDILFPSGFGYGRTAFIRTDKSFKRIYYSPENDFTNYLTDEGCEFHTCDSGDVQAPEVTVSSPASNDVLVVGTDHNITWTATDNIGVESRLIEFQKNNSSPWTTIDSASGNTGTFTWTVPDEVSANCKIRVSAYDAAGNVGNNLSGTFEIEPATNIIYHPEKAGNLIKLKRFAGSFQVYIPFSGEYIVTVSDLHGKTLSTFTTSADRNWYTISQVLPSGMHILSIKTAEKTFVEKFWFVR